MKAWVSAIAVAALLGGEPATAQQPITSVEYGPPLVPAEADAAGRITFRVRAPSASAVNVLISNQKQGSYPLAKGADGVWTGTAGPFAPEIYEYAFEIGGARFPSDFVEVPGAAMRVYDLQDVPHGAVSIRRYVSRVQGRARRMYVYLPPQYFTEPSRRFPVLYLFSGMDEDQWTGEGRANFIFDNLIAAGTVTPTIVVMPNNTTGPHPVPALQNAAIMEKEITGEIIPMIERDYRVIADRDHRAIAGLSFGGGTAFTIGVRHLELFGYVGEFATGVFGGAEHTAYAPGYADFNPDTITPGLYAKLADPATRPHLLFMSVGSGDPRNPYQKQAFASFKAHGAATVFHEYAGGNEFRVFRPSLVDFAPMLFR